MPPSAKSPLSTGSFSSRKPSACAACAWPCRWERLCSCTWPWPWWWLWLWPPWDWQERQQWHHWNGTGPAKVTGTPTLVWLFFTLKHFAASVFQMTVHYTKQLKEFLWEFFFFLREVDNLSFSFSLTMLKMRLTLRNVTRNYHSYTPISNQALWFF